MKTIIGKALEALCRPKGLRSRPEPKAELNDAVMGRLRDEDPVYRALMDRAFEQLEGDMMAATGATRTGQNGERIVMTSEERAYYAGAANAIARFLMGVEAWREGARAAVIEEMKKRQNR